MAYDASRGRTVLFGGSNGSKTFNDTWEFDGTSWRDATPANSPPPLKFPSMGYDADGQKIVLFGAVATGPITLNGSRDTHMETWLWDGVDWSNVTPEYQPGIRAVTAAMMAWDPVRRVVVLFGGCCNTNPDPILAPRTWGDTWTWNGSVWSEVTSAGPDSRDSFGMAWDPLTSSVLLQGGKSGSVRYNDTWRWDGTWHRLTPAHIPGTAATSRLAHDATIGRVVLVRSTSGSAVDNKQAWIWSGTDWVNGGVVPAQPRDGAGFAERLGGGTLLFGGQAARPLDDTWLADSTGWRATRQWPRPRRDFGLAYDPIRRVVVLFGGTAGGSLAGGDDEAQDPMNDVWEWNGTKWTRASPIGTQPLPRFGIAMTYNPRSQKVLLFGGYARAGCTGQACVGAFMNDTWEWDGVAWTKLAPIAVPTPRMGASIAYEPAFNTLALVSGNGAASPPALDDFYLWTGLIWAKQAGRPWPTPRSAYAMTYDPFWQQAVLFGGDVRGESPPSTAPSASLAPLGDTWVLRRNTWTTAAQSGPTPRSGVAAAASSGHVYAYGGRAGVTPLDDLWAFDGSAWSAVTLPGSTAGDSPGGRYGHSMVYIAATGSIAMFGGCAEICPANDIWELVSS